MFMNAKRVIENKNWNNNQKIKISVITPTYNRADTLMRTINSIEKQTLKEWEYIIVDDGSTDDTERIVVDYMNTTDHPVTYVSKENGGVHTARNIGFLKARGELLINLDSDDELLPNALMTFWNAWEDIPDQNKCKYREIVAQCMDDNGKRVGRPFDDDINQMPWNQARKICYESGGEHVACMVTEVMKNNLFPEPEGVTFLTENILWRKLDQKFRAFYINDMLRVYHLDGENHLSSGLSISKKKSIQNCRNALWESSTFVNNWKVYQDGGNYLKEIIRYSIMKNILRKYDKAFMTQYKIKTLRGKAMYYLLLIPSFGATMLYKRKLA